MSLRRELGGRAGRAGLRAPGLLHARDAADRSLHRLLHRHAGEHHARPDGDAGLGLSRRAGHDRHGRGRRHEPHAGVDLGLAVLDHDLHADRPGQNGLSSSAQATVIVNPAREPAGDRLVHRRAAHDLGGRRGHAELDHAQRHAARARQRIGDVTGATSRVVNPTVSTVLHADRGPLRCRSARRPSSAPCS